MSDNPVKWTAAGLTPAGNALQAALLGTGDGLTFTRAVAADEEGVERLDLTLQSPCTVDGPKCRVPVLLTNAGVDTAFTMTELRFYVRRVTDGAPTGEEILYATVTDETGDPIPTAAQSPGFTIDWAFVFQYGNAGSVTVTLDPVGLVSIGMVGRPGGVAALGDNGAVPIEQGGFGGTTAQEALYNIGAEPNENLLDNAYFVGGGSQLGDGVFPINQHGLAVYNTRGYTIDRWLMPYDTAQLTLESDGIVLDGTQNSYRTALIQPLLNPSKFVGKTVTISAIAKLISGTGYGLGTRSESATIAQDSPTLNNTDYNLVSWTFIPTEGFNGVSFFTGNQSKIKVQAIKFEIGDNQTLGEVNSDGSIELFGTPNFSCALAKCQRYLLKIGYGRYRAVALNSGSIFYSVPIPVPMVSKPSIVDATKLTVENGISFNAVVAGFDLSVAYFADNAITISAVKENHGLTDSNLLMGNALFSAEDYS